MHGQMSRYGNAAGGFRFDCGISRRYNQVYL
jgi:hypothetical protein